MSVYVVREVWKYSESEHSARLVLLALADSGHKEWGTSTLKQETIGGMTRLAVSSVRDALRWLEDAVEIETRQAVKGRARINVYRVLLGEYAAVTVDESDLACRLLEPFSTPDQVAAMKASAADDEAPDDRRNLAVVKDATTASSRRDYRQNPALHKEEPVLDPTRANALVPDESGESEGLRLEISLALSVELGVRLSGMTRGERGAWESAVSQLVDVGATAVEIAARCRAYRDRWPAAALTPMAIVRHWSTLGAKVELEAPATKAAAWVEQTAVLLESQMAHELLDERSGLTDEERVGLHARIDELHQARQVA